MYPACGELIVLPMLIRAPEARPISQIAENILGRVEDQLTNDVVEELERLRSAT